MLKTKMQRNYIRLKYGKPSKVENQVRKEIWRYDYSSQFKSNNNEKDIGDKIITNKNMINLCGKTSITDIYQLELYFLYV